MDRCKYCTTTENKWLPNYVDCLVYHCHLPIDDVFVAQGHCRYPTKNDKINEERIEADYLCVRSKYCNRTCSYFSELME